MKAWLLRHAETAVPDVFHGAESDVGLSERGHRQAAALAEVFAVLRPEVVVCSAMRRAVATAFPVAVRCGTPLRVEPLLHERRVGILSGTRHDDPRGPWPETARRWMAGYTQYATSGAESFDDLHQRLVPVWERLAREFTGRSVVVVAHGIVCKVLLVSVGEGYTIADWTRLGPVRNCGVSELIPARVGKWQVTELNRVPTEVEDVSEPRTS